MKYKLSLLFFFLSLSFLSVGYSQGQVLKKTVLFFYETEEDYSYMHKNLDLIFNYYGVNVEYRTFKKGFGADREDLIGCVIWPKEKGADYPEYVIRTIKQIHEKKLKLLFLEHLPATINRKSGMLIKNSILKSLYEPFGLHYEKTKLRNPLIFSIDKIDKDIIDFERKFEFKGHSIITLRSVSEKNRVLLKLRHKTNPKLYSDLIVVGDFGAYAIAPTVLQEDKETFRRKWIVNPFRLVELCFNLGKRPIPDITTINGVRSIYCHIDGDAFNGICRFDKKRICGTVVYQDILKKYIFPHTLSLVHCWFDPDVDEVTRISVVDGSMQEGEKILINDSDRKKWVDAAKEIFKEPWVENALHGYGHPLFWRRKILALTAKKRPFTYEDEFQRSYDIFTKYISKKNTSIFLWTGDCNPDEEALAFLDKMGLNNMNGGDTLFDSTYDSYTSVAPFYKKLGRYTQIYTSASNENIYTNEWSGPYYGFRNVIETFKRTDYPRRISPVNIYYHWYSGELKASLNALEEVYDWADRQFLTPIYVGHHIDIVKGFQSIEIDELSDGWLVKKNKALKTIRFENCNQYPVLSEDSNILGFRHVNKRLYIHLGNANKSVIKLVEKAPSLPYLRWCNALLESVQYKPHGLIINDLWSFRDVELCFVNLPYTLEEKAGVSVRYKDNVTFVKLKPFGTKSYILEWNKKD